MAVGIGGLLDKIGLPALLNAIGGASVQISDRGLMAFPEAMQRVYNRYWTQPATDWVNRQLGIESTNKTPPAALGGASDPVDALRGYLERSKSIEQPSLSTWPQMGRSNRNIGSSDEPLEELLRDLPTYVPTWMDKKRIKIDPEIEPDLGKVSSKLEPAGAEAGAKFAAALKSEAERVGAVADELKARFSFTATPTISPNYSAVPSSASGPAPASTRRSSAQASRPVVNQKIYGKTDPRRTARAVIREENRAVRRTMARALHDRGPLA